MDKTINEATYEYEALHRRVKDLEKICNIHTQVIEHLINAYNAQNKQLISLTTNTKEVKNEQSAI